VLQPLKRNLRTTWQAENSTFWNQSNKFEILLYLNLWPWWPIGSGKEQIKTLTFKLLWTVYWVLHWCAKSWCIFNSFLINIIIHPIVKKNLAKRPCLQEYMAWRAQSRDHPLLLQHPGWWKLERVHSNQLSFTSELQHEKQGCWHSNSEQGVVEKDLWQVEIGLQWFEVPGSSAVWKRGTTQHPWENWKTFIQLNITQNCILMSQRKNPRSTWATVQQNPRFQISHWYLKNQHLPYIKRLIKSLLGLVFTLKWVWMRAYEQDNQQHQKLP